MFLQIMPVLAIVKFNKIFQDHLTNKRTVQLRHFSIDKCVCLKKYCIIFNIANFIYYSDYIILPTRNIDPQLF